MKCYQLATTNYVDEKINIALSGGGGGECYCDTYGILASAAEYTNNAISNISISGGVSTNFLIPIQIEKYIELKEPFLVFEFPLSGQSGHVGFSTPLSYDHQTHNFYFILVKEDQVKNAKKVNISINVPFSDENNIIKNFMGISQYLSAFEDSICYDNPYIGSEMLCSLPLYDKIGDYTYVFNIEADENIITHNFINNFAAIGFALSSLEGNPQFDNACLSIYAEY